MQPGRLVFVPLYYKYKHFLCTMTSKQNRPSFKGGGIFDFSHINTNSEKKQFSRSKNALGIEQNMSVDPCCRLNRVECIEKIGKLEGLSVSCRLTRVFVKTCCIVVKYILIT